MLSHVAIQEYFNKPGVGEPSPVGEGRYWASGGGERQPLCEERRALTTRGGEAFLATQLLAGALPWLGQGQERLLGLLRQDIFGRFLGVIGPI